MYKNSCSAYTGEHFLYFTYTEKTPPRGENVTQRWAQPTPMSFRWCQQYNVRSERKFFDVRGTFSIFYIVYSEQFHNYKIDFCSKIDAENRDLAALKCNLQLAVCSRHPGLDGIVFPAFRATFCTLTEPQKNQARPTSYVSDFYAKAT